MTEQSIDDLAGLIRQGLAEDERVAREACGETVVGEPGSWRQAPGGDEWEAEAEDDFVSLLVALRPGTKRSDPASQPYWGAIAEWQDNGDEPGVTGPLEQFRHAARHDPRRVLAEVASKRALFDEALGWKHRRDCWSLATNVSPPRPCDCGRDARVHAVLTHLAQPYQETT